MMKRNTWRAVYLLVSAWLITALLGGCLKGELTRDERMKWWRDARFGMFVHWGLYAVPAGEWNGETHHAEWIRTTARIPLHVYDQFREQFNPEAFDADAWVKAAKDAGMKYIVVTAKHHDGFCLFDSGHTDFDVMETPWKKDAMRALADACRKYKLKICWYYSIMDWHHPDYLPRRGWETGRSDKGADFTRYIDYMKAQLKELVTNYGDIGVLWFDGEWEKTWTREYGSDLYEYVRGLQADIIINNRVGPGRAGLQGMTRDGESAGDFGTPEQQIPAAGLPGADWETCMTMNDHWGWNKHDTNWKSAADLLRKLADIASKGGNFLLNVGPKPDGTFPKESKERLRRIGEWMDVNGESIYGTGAGPFRQLAWGRCTLKKIRGGTRLYLHVFQWPSDGRLRVPGIYNEPKKAWLLADRDIEAGAERTKDDIILTLPDQAPDTVNTVVVLDVKGRPDIDDPPVIRSNFDMFTDKLQVALDSDRENVTIRYTLDGSKPTNRSLRYEGEIVLRKTATVTAACFRAGEAVSATISREFRKVTAQPSISRASLKKGLLYRYYEGDWDRLPAFHRLRTVKSGVTPGFDFSARRRSEFFGFDYRGYIKIDRSGVYGFSTDSDDGSKLYIGKHLVVDNDGLHGLQEIEGVIPLEAGYHPLRVVYFQKTGGDELMVRYRGPGIEKTEIPDSLFFH